MGRAKLEDLPKTFQKNIKTLHKRINKFLETCPFDVKMNDGFRRPQDQPKNAATKSKHLRGAAIDLDDDDSAFLWEWVLNNLTRLKECGLWIEDPRWTHGKGTWMHFQIVPPGSGRRIYIPNATPANAPKLWDGVYNKSLNGKEQPT